MKDYNLFKIFTVAFKGTKVYEKGYEKLYIRKITDIVTLGMQNEGCGKYLNVQKVIGRTGLLRAFLNLLRVGCV
jgi:hypothetical protein